jgi:hypothetical protein
MITFQGLTVEDSIYSNRICKWPIPQLQKEYAPKFDDLGVDVVMADAKEEYKRTYALISKNGQTEEVSKGWETMRGFFNRVLKTAQKMQ